MARHGPIFDLCRSLANRDGIEDLALSRTPPSSGARVPKVVLTTELLEQATFKDAATLHEQTAVDRFRATPACQDRSERCVGASPKSAAATIAARALGLPRDAAPAGWTNDRAADDGCDAKLMRRPRPLDRPRARRFALLRG